MSSILEKIKEMMKEQNITMNDLVKKTGIKQSTLYYIFDNEENFLKTKLENMISIYDCINITKSSYTDLLANYVIEELMKQHPDAKKFITENQVALCQLTKKDLDTLSLMIQSMIKANKAENDKKDTD